MILPLKLGWEPFYILSEGERVCVGDRVRVPFAGRMYTAVVSNVGCSLPDGIKPSSVKEIYGTAEGMERILPTEIEFFRRIADYYMCTVGEVFKAAYPPLKSATVNSKIRETPFIPPSAPPQMHECERNTYGSLRQMMSGENTAKPVLLKTADAETILLNICAERAKNSNILWLVPEINDGKALEKRLSGTLGSQLVIWGSHLTPARRREAVRKIRGNDGYVVVGTRSALFLPHHDLDLIIICDEHDTSYKQSSPSPRYNGRDAAIMLGGIFNATVILTSPTPSLDSIFNSMTGKFRILDDTKPGNTSFEIIDTLAEMKKNGMCGDISRRVIGIASSTPAEEFAVYKPHQSAFPKSEDIEKQIRSLLPPGTFFTDNLTLKPLPSSCTTLVILGADALLGKPDFKADEKVFQIISGAILKCPGTLKRAIIQTREQSHPIFASLESSDLNGLLAERKKFSYPPFTRIVDILVNDNIPERCVRMTRSLYEILRRGDYVKVTPAPSGIRVVLKKDVMLHENKKKLLKSIEEFEKSVKWFSHIAFDVDPR